MFSFLASASVMPVHDLYISRPFCPTHNSKYDTCSSSVLAISGPEKINDTCNINFCHSSGIRGIPVHYWWWYSAKIHFTN